MSELSHDEKRKIAEAEIARRLDEYDHMRPQIAQLTKERDDLREALSEAVKLIEKELTGADMLYRNGEHYNIERMRALANLNKTDGE